MPLDPVALRKPGADGVNVLMADGQDWLVRRPRVLWMPDDNEDGFAFAFDLGPDYDALMKALEDATLNGQVFKAFFDLWSHLLRLNYELTTVDLKTLLRVDFGPMVRDGDPEPKNEGEFRFVQLRDIVSGREPAPKPTPAGSDSPSPPTA